VEPSYRLEVTWAEAAQQLLRRLLASYDQEVYEKGSASTDRIGRCSSGGRTVGSELENGEEEFSQVRLPFWYLGRLFFRLFLPWMEVFDEHTFGKVY
jgi:hypothetical protein